jgi:hypothetical protein
LNARRAEVEGEVSVYANGRDEHDWVFGDYYLQLDAYARAADAALGEIERYASGLFETNPAVTGFLKIADKCRAHRLGEGEETS